MNAPTLHVCPAPVMHVKNLNPLKISSKIQRSELQTSASGRGSTLTPLTRLIHCLAAAVLLAYPIAGGAQSPDTSADVFPLLVDGKADGMVYRSSLKIIPADHANPSSKCTITQRGTSAVFAGVNGGRYFADVFDAADRPAAITSVSLDTYLPWEILRSTADTALDTGYATVSCSGTVHTQLHVALLDSSGSKLGETTLAPAARGNSFEFLLDRRDGTRLGFSLINDSAAEGEYTVIARDEFNQEVDRTDDTLGAWDQISRFVDELLRLPSNFVGSIEIVGVGGGRSYVAGLQFTGPVFAVVSPIVRDSPLRF